MEEEWAHIDLGNQIDNSWNKDTTLALKLNKVGFVVKIRELSKKKIEKKYNSYLKSKENKKIKRKIVVMIYCFLLFKLLRESEGIAKKVKLCRDINPPNEVYSYLSKICNFYKIKPLNELGFKIRFNNDGKSKAHNLANKSYKGRKSVNYLIKDRDLEDLQKLINQYILKN